MSFLTDDNLTFHRFSDGTITFDSIRKKSTAYVDGDTTPVMHKKPKLILREVSNPATEFSCINEHTLTPPSSSTPYGVWTTQTSDSLNSYTNNVALNLSDESPSCNSNSKNLTYLTGRSIPPPPPPMTPTVNGNGSTLLANGSTMKLINTTSMEMNDDQATKQVSPILFAII